MSLENKFMDAFNKEIRQRETGRLHYIVWCEGVPAKEIERHTDIIDVKLPDNRLYICAKHQEHYLLNLREQERTGL